MAPSQLNILCIDDSKVMQKLVQTYLSGSYNIYCANNGQEGLEILSDFLKRNIRISLILCDINMPLMSGPEFIEKIRLTPSRFIPLIIMTIEKENQERFNFSYKYWLKKPFNKDELVDKVTSCIDPFKYASAHFLPERKILRPAY